MYSDSSNESVTLSCNDSEVITSELLTDTDNMLFLQMLIFCSELITSDPVTYTDNKLFSTKTR